MVDSPVLKNSPIFSTTKRMSFDFDKQTESDSLRFEEPNISEKNVSLVSKKSVNDSVPATNGRIIMRSESMKSESTKSESMKSESTKSESMQSRQSSQNSLFTLRAIVCIVLWYFFSFTTLFLNKYIVSFQKGDATMLGSFQILTCAFCGYFHLRSKSFFKSTNHSSGKKSNEKIQIKFSNFTRSLFIVGTLRFSTILLGLIALWYVPVSFAETIKSSAPVFTVFIARMVLGEHTSLIVNLSLIPVMTGLALCSAYELSFTLIGFTASLATNLSECMQNVFSKKLLTVERYEPEQLQFYTSVSSILIQIPCILILVDVDLFLSSLYTEKNLLLTYILSGISFHCQSITEYTLLSLISPVTHSVANTAKRALLIWLSVLIFGNPVTFLSWIGTGIVICGVLFYNKARQLNASNINVSESYHPLIQNETHDV